MDVLGQASAATGSVVAQIGMPTPAGYEWLGPVLAVLGLVAALVVLLRWWFSQRR